VTMAAATLTAWLAAMPAGSVCAVIGAPGSGKTPIVMEADRAGVFPRRVVFNPYQSRDVKLSRSGLTHKRPWGGILCTPRELAEYPDRLLDHPRAAVVVDPGTLESSGKRSMGARFRAVAKVVWHTAGVDLICEEVGLYGRESADLMNQWASGGGHSLARLVLICQSLGRIQKDARRNISHVVALAQGEPEDIDNLRRRCGRAFAEDVMRLRLGTGEARCWRLGDAIGVQT
jgi:hypothetical protein